MNPVELKKLNDTNLYYLHLRKKNSKVNIQHKLRTNKNKQEVLNKIVNDMESEQGLIINNNIYKKEDYSFRLY